MSKLDEFWMVQAIELAQRAADLGEVPVGALVIRNDKVLGVGYNQPISGSDPTAHAEINALRDAAKNANNYRLPGTTLYVTLEPCAMCAGAIVHARVDRVVFGTCEPKAGAVVSQQRFFENPWLNHRVNLTADVLQERCAMQISHFFQQRRDAKKRVREQANRDG